MAAGKLAQACDAFEASNRAEPRAGTLLHLGACRDRNRQLASAWSAYKDALTRAKDPVKRDVAAARAAATEPRLSYLTVSIPEHSRLDGLMVTRNGAAFDPSLWNRPLPVDGGEYVIAGRAADHEDWQVTLHVPSEGGRLSVTVPRLKELLRPGTAAVPHTADRRPEGLTMRRKIALGAAGVSLAGGTAGVVLGLLSWGNERDALQTCPDPAPGCRDAGSANTSIRSSYREALAANVAYGVAAAAALAAGVLWLTGAGEPEAARIGVAPHIAPRQSGVVVVGRF